MTKLWGGAEPGHAPAWPSLCGSEAQGPLPRPVRGQDNRKALPCGCCHGNKVRLALGPELDRPPLAPRRRQRCPSCSGGGGLWVAGAEALATLLQDISHPSLRVSLQVGEPETRWAGAGPLPRPRDRLYRPVDTQGQK